MKSFFINILYFLLYFSPSLAFTQNSEIDTNGLDFDLKKSNQLLYIDTKASMNITYKWDTKLANTKHYQAYAEFSIVHAINNFYIHSAYNAIEVIERALYSTQDSINKTTKAEMLAWLGFFYCETGEVNEAVSKLTEAQKLFENLDNNLKLNWTLAILGKCYSKLDNHTRADSIINNAINHLKNINASKELLDAYLIYFNNAIVYYNENPNWNIDTLQFSTFLNEAITLSDKERNTMAKGLVYNYYGNYLILNKDTLSSIIYYNKALDILTPTNNQYYIAQTRLDYGFSLLWFNKINEAIVQLEMVKELSSENGWIDILQKSYSFLASAHYSLKDYETASNYAGKSFTYKKYISNTKRHFEIEAQLANFDKEKQELITQQKNKDIEHLNSQRKTLVYFITVITASLLIIIFLFVKTTQKNKKLKTLSAENMFLLSEANHRIKNNLQLIVSLMARELNGADETKINSLKSISSKIESISTLHKLLYMKENKEEIDLTLYLTSIYENLGILIRENKVTIKIDFDEIMFNANRAVYVGLLFNELIINSLKHAFTPANSNRQITVLLKIINHQLVFNYSDNGIGIQLPVELKLITILTNQLKNKFIIEEKTGFNFSIKLT